MVLAHNISVPRTEDIKIHNEATFHSMMLSKPILDGLTSAGFYKPSPIQLLGIPLGKLGLDLILEAKSGTGKTVVFATIALEKIQINKGLQVLIVTPTREIAAQIRDVLQTIGCHIQGLKVETIIGGLPIKDDLEKLKNNVHILVGTPGRIKSLIKQNHIKTITIHLLILDEADKLMEDSFEADIHYINSALPSEKQTILCSATYPDSVAKAVNTLVQNPHHVCPDTSKILLGIRHRVIIVQSNSNSVRQTEIRFLELTKILSETEFKQCVIFCNYQARVTQLHKLLTKAKWPAELVYGKQQQAIRLEALKTLQEYKCRILISTNLLSRGIDSKNVDLVINFEPPDTCETYLHRIGRSGRYGSIGMAISIVSGEELNNFNKILEPIMPTIDMKLFWTGEKLNKNDLDNYQNNDQIIKKEEERPNTLTESESPVKNHCCETLWQSWNNTPKIENFDGFCESYNKANNTSMKYYENLWQSLSNTPRNGNFENFDDELDDSYNSENCTLKNNCQTLWESLSYTPKIENIETFDELCKSYKAICTSNILSFSDLLEDFAKMDDSLQKECENSIYRKVEFDDLNYKDSFKAIKKLKDEFHTGNSSDDNTFKDDDCILENTVDYPKNSGNNENESQLVNKNLNNPTNDFLLGLPKEFLTKRFNKGNKKQKYYSYKHGNTNFKKENIETTINNPKINCNITNIRKCDAYSDAKEQNLKKKKKEEEYNEWYNQLQARMKQIEQMLYIEEMNKKYL